MADASTHRPGVNGVRVSHCKKKKKKKNNNNNNTGYIEQMNYLSHVWRLLSVSLTTED